ncbi:MAG: hypothetical protein JEZ00_12660 [Anaerolineaceae bacterium]|nr:hypothetical protein [Anaerolineaceae bacterium]
MKQGDKSAFTKILAVIGTVLIWLPILIPIFFNGLFIFSEGQFLFDYLMPVELFAFALVGAGFLIWAAIRAKSKQSIIGWGLGIATATVICAQGLAVLSGLASGRTAATGLWILIVLIFLVIYILALILSGLGGILLLRDLFQPESTDDQNIQENDPMDLDQLKQTLKKLDSRCSSSPLEIFSPRTEDMQTFQDICNCYIAGDQRLRQQIQNVLHKKDGVQNCLVGYAYQCAQNLMDSKEDIWLSRGVAAVEMAKQSMDNRDLLLVLAELYVVAEECNLDPNPVFTDIAGQEDFSSFALVKSRRSGTHVVTKRK